MRTHDLKVWPEFFDALASGAKTFEIRKDDRSFAVGDELLLSEWDPTEVESGFNKSSKGYTGREVRRFVTYKFPGGRMGIPEGVCILGLAPPISKEKSEP